MYKIICIYLLSIILNINNLYSQSTNHRMTTLMGARFDITLVDLDSVTAENNIDIIIKEIKRIEYLISDWIDTTQVSRINQNAGIQPIKVDKEVLELTQRAIAYSIATKGAFDISFAAMERIWLFDGSMTTLPTKEAILNAKSKVNYKNIIIDTLAHTIFLKEKGMKIGFGAIGEGYATDKARQLMIAKGVHSGFVNGSGDISTWGKQADGSPWAIGVSDPFDHGNLMAVIPLTFGAITTSGSYEKYAEIDGKRYSHIINPATGYPSIGLISVSVMGPDAEVANALSTSIMVLGAKKGLQLLKKYTGYKCFMITDKGAKITSKNFNLKPYLQ